MSETLEEKVARLERDLDHTKTLAETAAKTAGENKVALFGSDMQSGLTRDFRDLKTETRYMRIIYVVVTALILPWLNALLGKLGLGSLKIIP